MSTKKHKLKLRILCAFMAFLVAFVHIPITSFAATDEVLQDNTVVISLDEILDKLIKTRGNGITVNGLDEEVRDEIGDAAIVMKGTESGITYLVVAYIMGEESEMYRNKDKAEIINSILSLSVVFVNKKDTEQEINFVFQADDLCEYDLMEDLRTVKEPEQEESESKKKSKSVEATQAESKENNNEVSTEPSGEESSEANSEINTEAATEAVEPTTDRTADDSTMEAEVLPANENTTEFSTEAEVTPSEEVSNESPSEEEVTSSEEASTESPAETEVTPSEEVSDESPSETDVPPSNETPAVPSAETVTIPSAEITNSNSVLSEADLASSEAVNYQTPVEAAVLATALDAAAVPSAIQYEGIGSFSNGSVRLLGKSAGAVDIQLGEAKVDKKYRAYLTGTGIKIIDGDEEHVAFCYNHAKSSPDKDVKKNPYYFKYEYENLPPDYKDHLENNEDVINANQSEVSMLLAVGYPNDSRGYQAKHNLNDMAANLYTQNILHSLLDPSHAKNFYLHSLGLNAEESLAKYLNENPYANDLYQAAKEGYNYLFSFELEGDIVFSQAPDNSYQTDILSTKGTLNGYYEFETLPGNIKVHDLQGNDISNKRIKINEPFRFVSSTMPTAEESLGIRITCKHSEPTIYYYMPENKSFQNLISLELSDSYEIRKLNILDVIEPGEPDPPFDPDPDPEVPPVDPDPEVPPVNPEPETPTVIPDNNTPSGGGGGPSGNTPDNNGPGPGTVPEATIPDGDVPLAQLPPAGLPSDPDLSLIEIDDGEVPLAPLPKTGQESAAGKLFLFSSLLGGLWLMTEMKSRKKNG